MSHWNLSELSFSHYSEEEKEDKANLKQLSTSFDSYNSIQKQDETEKIKPSLSANSVEFQSERNENAKVLNDNDYGYQIDSKNESGILEEYGTEEFLNRIQKNENISNSIETNSSPKQKEENLLETFSDIESDIQDDQGQVYSALNDNSHTHISNNTNNEFNVHERKNSVSFSSSASSQEVVMENSIAQNSSTNQEYNYLSKEVITTDMPFKNIKPQSKEKEPQGFENLKMISSIIRIESFDVEQETDDSLKSIIQSLRLQLMKKNEFIEKYQLMITESRRQSISERELLKTKLEETQKSIHSAPNTFESTSNFNHSASFIDCNSSKEEYYQTKLQATDEYVRGLQNMLEELKQEIEYLNQSKIEEKAEFESKEIVLSNQIRDLLIQLTVKQSILEEQKKNKSQLNSFESDYAKSLEEHKGIIIEETINQDAEETIIDAEELDGLIESIKRKNNKITKLLKKQSEVKMKLKQTQEENEVLDLDLRELKKKNVMKESTRIQQLEQELQLSKRKNKVLFAQISSSDASAAKSMTNDKISATISIDAKNIQQSFKNEDELPVGKMEHFSQLSLDMRIVDESLPNDTSIKETKNLKDSFPDTSNIVSIAQLDTSSAQHTDVAICTNGKTDLESKTNPQKSNKPNSINSKQLSHFAWMELKQLKEKLESVENNLYLKKNAYNDIKKSQKQQSDLISKLESEKFKLNQKLKSLESAQKDKEDIESFSKTVKILLDAIDRKIYHKERKATMVPVSSAEDKETSTSKTSTSAREVFSGTSLPTEIIPFMQILIKKVQTLLLDYERLERNMLAKSINDKKDVSSVWKTQIDELKKQLNDARQELATKEDRIVNQTATLHELRTTRKNLTKELSKYKSMQSELESLKEIIRSKEQIIEEKDTRIVDLHLKQSPIDPRFHSELAVLKRSNEVLKIQVAQLNDQVANTPKGVISNTEKLGFEKEKRELISTAEKLKQENKKLKEMLAQVKKQEDIQEEYRELQTMYKHAVKLNKQYERRLRELVEL